ncbi:MAG: type VI secretion system baseplate subunit TssE [Beijerinckiaceae bacterium]
MSRKIGKDRLSPPLIYAFRSAHNEREYRARAVQSQSPEAAVPSRTPAAAVSRTSLRTPITEYALREEVARDLNALVNTISMESAVDLTDFDAVRRSILNFGIRDLNARFADQAGNGALVRDVEKAIRLYEPRLVGQSIHVNQIIKVDEPTLTVRLEISADLSCEPVNLPVVFIADIDVDSCDIAISRAGVSR